MKVYRLYLETIGPGPTCKTLEQVKEELEGLEPGDSMRVTADEMTEEEYSALGEWDGY